MTSLLSFLSNCKVRTLYFHTSKSGKKLERQRRGVSPVIATTIILAITITLGLSLWSFANSGVSVATQEYASAVTSYGEFVNDKFVIANVDFDNPSDNHISFWIYNNGKLPTTIDNVALTCKGCSDAFDPEPTGLVQDSPVDQSKPLTVSSKDLKKFSFNTQTTLEDSMTYELTVITETGATHSFIKRSD